MYVCMKNNYFRKVCSLYDKKFDLKTLVIISIFQINLANFLVC